MGRQRMRKTPFLLAVPIFLLAVPMAFSLALGLAAADAAAAEPSGHGKFFDKLDANKDGVITQAEARAARTRHFDRLDQDHDGTISLEEFQAKGARRFLRFDLDGDGRITREEMAQAKREHHKQKAD